MHMRTLTTTLMVLALSFGVSSAFSADYSAEVMTLEGTAQVLRSSSPDKSDLKEGDFLQAGDLLEVGPASFVDLAYDKEWKNLTRISENSRIKIVSIFPTGLKMDHGNLFAKLGQLPKGSTFEVRTPTAVAAVRGTEFLVSVDEKGSTEVIGFEGRVEVFNLNGQGNLGDKVELDGAQKTKVVEINQPPSVPEKIDGADLKMVESMSGDVDKSAEEVMAEGREGQVQFIGTVEAMEALADAYHLPDAGDNVPAPEGDKPPLTSEQMAALREQFVEMGGDPAEFEMYKDSFNEMDTGSFDQMHDSFETQMMEPPPPGSTTSGDGTTTAPDGSPTPGTGDGGLPPPPDPTSFGSHNTDNIDQNMNQIQQNVYQTIQNTVNNPPPSPPNYPCTDPANCPPSTTSP